MIAVLLALAASSLLKSRGSAQDLAFAQRAASHAAVMALYRHDFRELFPFFTNPAGGPVELASSNSPPVQAWFFDAPFYWNIALADGYYDGNHRSPFSNREHPGSAYNTWRYPIAFITRPAYWNTRTREPEPRQFAPTRGDEVRFPAAKALIVEYLISEQTTQSTHDFSTGRNAVAFTDGHAGSLRQYQLHDGGLDIRPPLWSDWSRWASWYHPFGITADGVYGRDAR